MALVYSNLTGSSASRALKGKLSNGVPSLAPPVNSSALNLSNLGKPQVPGVTNMNVVPPQLRKTTQTAPQATTSTSRTAPQTSKPVVQATQPAQPTQPVTPTPVFVPQVTNTTPQAPVTEPKKSKKIKEQPKPTLPDFSGLVGDLANLGKNGSQMVQRSNDQLVEFRKSAANYRGKIYSAPTSARVMQGRDAQTQLVNAQTDAALAAGVQNALAAQAQEISALQGAGGLAQPVQIAPGNTLSSPISGDTIAGGLGGYVNYRTAEQVMGLINQYPDAQYIYDEAKTPQQNLQAFQSQALQRSPTYQRTTYGVPGATSVAGGTATMAAQQGYTQAVQTYQNLKTQKDNADGQANLLLQALKNSGINPTDARFANRAVGELRRQLSSADQQVFDSALKETQAAYGQLLVSGGGATPTGAQEAYNTILNPNASLAAISAAIEQLKAAGNAKLAAQGNQVNTYFGQLQAGSPASGAPGGNVFAEQW